VGCHTAPEQVVCVTMNAGAPRWILAAALAAIAGVAAVLWVVARDDPPVEADPGAAAAEQYVHSYVDALNANSLQRLGELIGKPPGSADVRERLRHFGGRSLTDVRVSVVSEFPRHYRAGIRARSASGAELTFYEVLAWEDGRWGLAPAPQLTDPVTTREPPKTGP
jgi:hypothetical protein